MAEHGLRAGFSIGRESRAHPVTDVLRHCKRSVNQGGTASIIVALGFSKGGFIFWVIGNSE